MALRQISTVIIPANSLNLTTLDRAKLRFKKTDTADDEYLEKLAIPAASSRANNYCSRMFVQQTYDDAFRALPGTCSLWEHWTIQYRREPGLVLRQAPIRRIEHVIEDDITLTEGTDYEFDADFGIVYRLGVHLGFTTTVVRYIAGWDAPPSETAGSLIAEAPEVEEAVLDMVLAAYAGRARDPMLREHSNNQSGTDAWWVGGLRLTPGSTHGVPQEAADILDNFDRSNPF